MNPLVRLRIRLDKMDHPNRLAFDADSRHSSHRHKNKHRTAPIRNPLAFLC